MIDIYGIKNCDSTRKAVKFLKDSGIKYTFHDYRETPVDKKQIEKWIESGATIKQLFNTRGTTYRNLKLKDLKLDDNGKLEWMAKENMLIKRPVVVNGNKIAIGYKEEELTNLIRQ